MESTTKLGTVVRPCCKNFIVVCHDCSDLTRKIGRAQRRAESHEHRVFIKRRCQMRCAKYQIEDSPHTLFSFVVVSCQTHKEVRQMEGVARPLPVSELFIFVTLHEPYCVCFFKSLVLTQVFESA